jgi:hypothetical protein
VGALVEEYALERENERLRELLSEIVRYVGDVDCSGYKCRLPQCGDCNYEPDNGYIELLNEIEEITK